MNVCKEICPIKAGVCSVNDCLLLQKQAFKDDIEFITARKKFKEFEEESKNFWGLTPEIKNYIEVLEKALCIQDKK